VTWFAHMLTDSVTLEALTGAGSDGGDQFGAAQTADAKVFESAAAMPGDTGVTDDEDTGLLLDVEASEGDRITLPDGEKMRVKAAGEATSIDGSTSLYWAAG